MDNQLMSFLGSDRLTVQITITIATYEHGILFFIPRLYNGSYCFLRQNNDTLYLKMCQCKLKLLKQLFVKPGVYVLYLSTFGERHR